MLNPFYMLLRICMLLHICILWHFFMLLHIFYAFFCNKQGVSLLLCTQYQKGSDQPSLICFRVIKEMNNLTLSSYVLCPMSYVLSPLSFVLYLMYYVLCIMSYDFVVCFMSYIVCIMFYVLYNTNWAFAPACNIGLVSRIQRIPALCNRNPVCRHLEPFGDIWSYLEPS